MNASTTLEVTRRHESSSANTFRLTDEPPVFVKGEGCWLFDESGDAYLDMVCGSSTTNLGHAHPALQKAAAKALNSGIVHTGTRLPSPFRAELYERLSQILPNELHCIQLLNSGAEAIETAIKVCQFATRRQHLAAFKGGYHGRTLGALSITDGERIRQRFSTLDSIVEFLPDPYEDIEHCLQAVEHVFKKGKADNALPALIILEAIQGVSGVRQPDDAFFTGLRALCTHHDVPLVVDEIWNGFGRAGSWFAYEHVGLRPDLVVFGKALSGGLPLSGVASAERFLKSWPAGMHTSTFQGNPVACAMASANIETIRNEGLLDYVHDKIECLLQDALRPLQTLSGVKNVRVVGAQAAVQLRTMPSVQAPNLCVALQRKLLQRKILVYGGGIQGDCLMFIPPINAPEQALVEGLNIVTSEIRKSAS